MIFESALYLVMCAGAPESVRSLSSVPAAESTRDEDGVDVRLWEAYFQELIGRAMVGGDREARERVVHHRRTP